MINNDVLDLPRPVRFFLAPSNDLAFVLLPSHPNLGRRRFRGPGVTRYI